jgi:hypothetical protein
MTNTTVRPPETSKETKSGTETDGSPQRLSPTERKSAQRDMSASEKIARKLSQAAGDEDPAHVAGAIVLFATDTIKRSAENLADARGYLDGMRIAIDGMLKNAFPEKPPADDADGKA